MRLGVDFGTTRTIVAAAMDGRYAVASFDVNGEYREYLPSIAVLQNQQLRFGWDAVAAIEDDSSQVQIVLRSIKRVISALEVDALVPELAPFEITAIELLTAFLTYVKKMVLHRSNLELNKRAKLTADISVPANANSRQRYLTLEAFKRAGFKTERMLNEPTAAAIEFAYQNRTAISDRSPKRYVVVYDLGGGTFDTTAVSLEGRSFELLVSEGIARLGGDDFDAAILDLAMEALGLPLPENRSLQERLLESCREAKESLRPTSRKLMVDLSRVIPDTTPAVLDVNDLYERCLPLVEQSLELIHSVFAALESHGIDPLNPRELGGLYLVGGGVLFPLVGKELRNQFKRKIQLAPQPHAATAVGLAIAGDDQAGILVREATTRHIGVWREAEAGADKIFDIILEKGTRPENDAPLVVERVYHPAHDLGHLRFMECGTLGPDGQPTGDIMPWREVHFPYDPALAEVKDLAKHPPQRLDGLSPQEIVETYRYDTDGAVSVTIENRSAGYRHTFNLGTP